MAVLSGFKAIKNYISFRNFIILSPIFFLTVQHWTSAVVVVASAGALIFIAKNKQGASTGHWKWAAAMALGAPLMAVLVGQLLRGTLYFPNMDAPLRLALCVPTLWAVSKGWLNQPGSKPVSMVWIERVIPLTLLWTFFFRLNWPTAWDVDLTTYFVDPLTFGSYCLLFSMVALVGISFNWSSSTWILRFLGICSVLCGVYLSLTSGSRTGWINLPIFITIWSVFFLKPRWGGQATLKVAAIALLGLGILVFREDYLVEKFALAVREIQTYNWDSVNDDTSVRLRISFYRMGYYYFMTRPFQGWGDLGWTALMSNPEFQVYASEFARLSPKHGFHNEIITSAVRSGLWGLAASVFFYVYFLLQGIKGFITVSTEVGKVLSFVLLIFMTHLVVMGMTTEITNLIFLSSFIGLTLAVLLGEVSRENGVDKARHL